MAFIIFAMNISFGQKIPLYQTQILDKETNKFEKATLYELDCKDDEDVDYVIKQHDAWEYKYNISVDMYEKNRRLKNYDNLPDSVKQNLQNNKFYVLENDKKEMLGLCEITGFNHFFNIQYLESNNTQKSKYKYIGQSILAGISKHILSHNIFDPVLMIIDPSYKSRGFYTEKCHFSDDKGSLIMDEQALKTFVSDVEQKIQSPVIDLKG